MQGKLNYLNNTLHKLGYELKKYNPSNSEHFQLRRILEINEIDLVIDVGANDGGYGSFLRNIGYKGKIISFEPLREAYEKLLKKSEKDSEWEIAPRMAIGDFNGEVEINVSRNSYSSSILDIKSAHLNAAPDSNYIGTETVKINKLDTLTDDILPQNLKKCFLKMDVQGYESNVLNGANKLVSNICGLQTELSLTTLYEDQILYDEIIENLQNIGFRLYTIFPGFTANKTGRLLQMDGIFIREEAAKSSQQNHTS